MNTRVNNWRVALVLCAGLACAAGLRPVLAADASAWSEDLRSSMRLIAGSASAAAFLRAGVEIKMQPGWKTYWRYPGDSGVPPRFDFSASDNLKSATVLWPAPHRFTDESGSSIGYKDSVIFPVHAVPRENGKPVTLRLKLDYAVCEKLCVPAQGSAELGLAGGASALNGALAAAEARVPKRVPPADVQFTAKRVTASLKPLVAVDFAAPPGANVELFAEGPSPEWALPIPSPAQGAPPDRRHFGFELDGLPPGADPKGAFALTFTIVTGDKAVEVTAHLD